MIRGRELRFRKTRAADDGFGDRACAVHTPGRYEAVWGDEVVAEISGAATKYMEAASWDLLQPGGIRSIAHALSTLRMAKKMVADRLEKFGQVRLPEWAIYSGRCGFCGARENLSVTPEIGTECSDCKEGREALAREEIK